MQQTIFAFLGVMILMALGFNQQRRKMNAQDSMIDQEIEIMANGMAMHVIEFAGARSFDARTVPLELQTNGLPLSDAEFSPRSSWAVTDDYTYACDLVQPFMSGPTCDDMSDLNMAPSLWRPVNFVGRDGKTINLDAHIEVYYVDDTNPDVELPAASTSNFKKVIVTIRSDDMKAKGQHENGLLTIERVFAYNQERESRRAGL